MPRSFRLVAALAAALLSLACAAAPLKVLRVPYLIAETSFDPTVVNDEYSGRVCEEIFESPLTYDFLARPAKLKPQTLEAMPEISEGGRTYTLHIRRVLYFADDAAFGGRKRELVARDYEYAIKRMIDPHWHSPNLWLVEDRIEGVQEAVKL